MTPAQTKNIDAIRAFKAKMEIIDAIKRLSARLPYDDTVTIIIACNAILNKRT